MGCESKFESNGDAIVTEGSVVFGHVGVLVDSHQVGINDVSNITIKEAGLYKVDMGMDVFIINHFYCFRISFARKIYISSVFVRYVR